jgi:hypothetical protein
MRFDKCQEYFDIYVENPDVCSVKRIRQDTW